MVRPVRLLALLAVLASVGVVLAVPGTASARQTPTGAPFHVYVLDRIGDPTFKLLAERGAVGLLRPGYGPTTNRRRALAELVRGSEVNARLGGVPKGKPLIDVTRAAVFPNCHHLCIVLQLPPKGAPIANNRLYRVAVIGRGFHGLLTSPTTHIPGLVSIVDIAPTALGGHPATTLAWTPSANPLGRLSRLGHAIGANNRLKFAALFILAGVMLALALLGLRAAVTAVPAALLVNLALGMGQISNEVLLCAAVSAGTVLLALGSGAALSQRICAPCALRRSGRAVRGRDGHPTRVAGGEPIRSRRRTRGSGGSGTRSRRCCSLRCSRVPSSHVAASESWASSLFGFFGLVVMTDNRIGADGGGAIALGIALAVLGARLFRLGVKGFVGLLASAALAVLWIVSRGLAQRGPNHLRSAFSDHGAALFSSLESRVPLSYVPAVHAWQMVLPLLLVLAAAFALAWRGAQQQSTREVLLAFGVAIVTSLLVNDSAAYELAAANRRRRRLRAFRPGSRDRAVAHPCLRSREAPARAGAGPGSSESPPG